MNKIVFVGSGAIATALGNVLARKGIYAKWPIVTGSIRIKNQLYYFIQHQKSQDETGCLE